MTVHDCLMLCRSFLNHFGLRETIKIWWNDLALSYGFNSVRKIDSSRLKNCRGRGLDVGLSVEISNRLKSLDSFASDSNWFGFDWIFKSDTNLNKLLEGNFSVKVVKSVPVVPKSYGFNSGGS